MAVKTVVAGSSVTASQLKDLFRQIDDGSINGPRLQAFLEHRNPFAWEYNENGHIILSIIGTDLTGEAEVQALVRQKYHVDSWAQSCFKSTDQDGYDTIHRLKSGQTYRIVLVSGKSIEKRSERSTKNLFALSKRYGYLRPQAGIVPRLREKITDKQLKELGWSYIVALHKPIVSEVNEPGVLGLFPNVLEGGSVDVNYCTPNVQWDDNVAFAFLAPCKS